MSNPRIVMIRQRMDDGANLWRRVHLSEIEKADQEEKRVTMKSGEPIQFVSRTEFNWTMAKWQEWQGEQPAAEPS